MWFSHALTFIWSWKGAALGVLVISGAFLHGYHVSTSRAQLKAETIAERDREWRETMKDAEEIARRKANERSKEDYRAGVRDEQARAEAAMAEQKTADVMIKEVMRISPSAATCNFDDPTAGAVNKLRSGM